MAQASKRRSSRQMASRKRSRYAEPDTDDDLMEQSDFDSDQEPPRELTGASRPSKLQKITKHRPKTRSKTTPSKTPARRKKKQKKRQTFVVGQPRRARTVQKEDELLPGKFTGPSDGVIPAWTSLPQNILRDIFSFGSQPLTAENATWLVGAARTCRAFMEPALEALYHWPAIWSPLHLHRLLELLKRKEGRLMNYDVKIRRLDIDVRRLAYTAHNRPLFDLSELIPEMPRLQHMEIVHQLMSRRIERSRCRIGTTTIHSCTRSVPATSD
ncbi:hypothetical protein MRB53_040591 [Persea americana]|nr:hypothetical protein MRB53_040591 [Persea americana]